MARRKKPSAPQKNNAPDRQHDRVQPWLSAAVAALLVMQVLVPGDGVAVALGSGLPLVMLWLVALIAWSASAARRQDLHLRVGAVDVAFYALVFAHTMSGLWATQHAAPRPAINLTWEWIGFGVAFFLVRQLVVRPREIRAVVAMMVALGVVLAAFGAYQIGWSLPEARRAYEANPERELQLALGTPNPSPLAKQQFEDRLYSPEPLASYNLANSLAAYLVPWFIVAVGIGLSCRSSVRTALFGAGASALAIGACLFFTKSRSGFVATATGLVLLAAVWLARDTRQAKRNLILATAMIAVLAIGAIAIMQIDHPELSGAQTSMRFRVEYWRSSLNMIADQPLFGCGPGNFQDAYAAYKLPQASEDVADPHNFIVEVWITAGTAAGILLAAALAAFFAQMWRALASDDSLCFGNGDPVDGTKDPDATDHAVYLLAGGLAGIVLAAIVREIYFVVIVSTWTLLLAPAGVCIAAAVIATFWPWIRGGGLRLFVPVVAVVVLLIHLLAAGGIGSHGIAGILWLLVAVCLSIKEAATATRAAPRYFAVGLLLVTIGVAALCQITAYGPVIKSRTALRQALDAQIAREDSWANSYLIAARTDPLDAEPLRAMARHTYKNWLAALDQAEADAASDLLHADFRSKVDAWYAVAPRRARSRREVGNMYLRAYGISGRDKYLTAAIAAYQQAIDRYPNNSLLHAHLAWAYHLTGDKESAARAATEALRLDDLNPHWHLKLERPYQRLADLRLESANTRDLMEQLRDGSLRSE